MIDLESCMASSGTMEGSPQGGGIRICSEGHGVSSKGQPRATAEICNEESS